MTNRINKAATVGMLHRIADAITQPRVLKLIEANDSRFGSDGTGSVEDLHDKLRHDFDFQLQQALCIHSSQYHVLSLAEKLDAMSEKLSDLANELSHSWRVKLKKSDQRFTVPKYFRLQGQLSWLVVEAEPHRMALEQSRAPDHPDYLWKRGGQIAEASQFIHAFYKLVLAKDTLSEDTGLMFYEDLLTQYGNKIEWLIKGYPHDLLVHDRLRLAGGVGEDYLGIGIMADRCSTWTITTESESYMKNHGYRMHYRKTYARSGRVAA